MCDRLLGTPPATCKEKAGVTLASNAGFGGERSGTTNLEVAGLETATSRGQSQTGTRRYRSARVERQPGPSAGDRLAIRAGCRLIAGAGREGFRQGHAPSGKAWRRRQGLSRSRLNGQPDPSCKSNEGHQPACTRWDRHRFVRYVSIFRIVVVLRLVRLGLTVRYSPGSMRHSSRRCSCVVPPGCSG